MKFKVRVESEENNTATIAIEPLEAGYGNTLGNGLRRTLLSSLVGAAITSVKITGVSHQFSTIPGVIEDVIQIILNLKKVRVKLYGDKPVKMRLTANALGEVKAGAIDTLGQAEITNPDQHIATISDAKAKLTMEMNVESGVGYAIADERKSTEIGVIPVDAIFSPVSSVNYTVDQTRVGRRTDFDKLTMVVTTDGSLSPLEAVNKSAEILSAFFHQIYDPSEEEETEEVKTPSFIANDMMKASIEELDLPVRISNALKAIDIDTIGKLTTTQPTLLMKAKNLGAKSLTLISEKLTERGLSLGEA